MPVDLPRPARQVLAELELCMHGKAASWNPSGTSHGDSESRMPQGEASPPHLVWRKRFLACAAVDLAGLIEDAREELKAIRGYGRANIPPPQEETREQWEDRLLADGEGFEARYVAVKFSCGVRDVTRIRTANGRDPNTGEARIVELYAKGLSERTIADMTGVPKTTVRRVLANAA